MSLLKHLLPIAAAATACVPALSEEPSLHPVQQCRQPEQACIDDTVHNAGTPAFPKAYPILSLPQALFGSPLGKRDPSWRDFLGVYRWDPLVRRVEGEYHLEEGSLAGLAWHESHGLSLALGKSCDAGLTQIIPTTAVMLGVRPLAGTEDLYGQPSECVARVRALLAQYGCKPNRPDPQPDCDYVSLGLADQRFDPYRNLDAAARYVVQEATGAQALDRAFSAFNRGTPKKHPARTGYVRAARGFQQMYVERRKRIERH